MRSERGWDCLDCLHTPSGACPRHSIEGTELVTVEPKYISVYKERIWGKDQEGLIQP